LLWGRIKENVLSLRSQRKPIASNDNTLVDQIGKKEQEITALLGELTDPDTLARFPAINFAESFPSGIGCVWKMSRRASQSHTQAVVH
jgi:hypothetical protein